MCECDLNVTYMQQGHNNLHPLAQKWLIEGFAHKLCKHGRQNKKNGRGWGISMLLCYRYIASSPTHKWQVMKHWAGPGNEANVSG